MLATLRSCAPATRVCLARWLLLSEGGVQVQQERLHVRAEIGDQKRRLVRHEPADEVNVTREPVELSDGDGAMLPVATGFGQCGSELRAAVERVRTLARLDLDMLGDDLEALGLGEADDGGTLGVDAKPRAALLAGADPVVGDERF